VYENEIGDQKKALEAYETAAGWYESDNAEALASKLYLKVGDLAALEGDYKRATEKFEGVAKASLQNNLMRWSVKEYMLKAGICHLAAGDLVATKRALEMYKEWDNSFVQQRECLLLEDLVHCVEEGDQDGFSEKLFQYDQMSKLDKWKTGLLLRVKGTIEKEEEDFS
jgi:alpha-soluble NSF attachment protein